MDTYYNVHESWKHFGKWKKPLMKDLLYNYIYMKYPK